ncbi:MAG: 50S ribosomal protein L18 [Planctomycetota bacterium]
MDRNKEKQKKRSKRHKRAKSGILGTAEKPRLCVYRSLNNLYCQLIDDLKGCTIASVSSIDKEIRETLPSGGNITAAKAVGKKIAEKAKVLGITTVTFDRGGYKYHGRVKAIADSAREAGLSF